MNSPNTVKLLIGTNKSVYHTMLRKVYNNVVFASDNLETVAHYYEGVVVEITVKLLSSKRNQYIRSEERLSRYKNGYNWGATLMRCPAGATWYSFSGEYLEKYLVNIREVHPDLSRYFEE